MRAVLLILLAACGRFGFEALDRDAVADTPGVGGRCNVSDVATGRSHTCMIESGNVWCWGANSSAQSDPVTELSYALTPTRVALPAPAVQVAAGRVFSCARLDSGDVYCWGDNNSGSLGDGTLAPRTAPVRVELGGETAIDLAAGTYHACIRRASDLSLMCWGANDFLQAGSDLGTEIATPIVVPAPGGVLELGIGHKHNCVVDGSATARCWGRNEYGQLADTSGPRALPTPGNITGPVRAIAAGGRHTCGLTTAGDVRCWGKNQHGQLGATPDDANHPSESSVLLSQIRDIHATASGAYALRDDGRVAAFGDVYRGDGTLGISSTPSVGPMTNVEKLGAHYHHACAIATGGQLTCWGSNQQAELGRGKRELTPVPIQVPIPASALFMYGRTVCARTTGDEVRCWGSGARGQFGLGDRGGHYEPTIVPHGLTGLVGFRMGDWHACAWNATTVRCWGWNAYAEAAGNLTNYYQLTPTTIAGITAPTLVTTGSQFTCVADGGFGRCWGSNQYGQLGNSSLVDSPTPVTVGALADPTHMSSGALHTCAISATAVFCWGWNASGQLGDGTTQDRQIATPTNLVNATDVAAGGNHTCAVANSGNVYCWGNNEVGQLGLGDSDLRTTPTQVSLPDPAVSLTVATEGTCVRLETGAVYCWGNGEGGQLGDGMLDGTLSPRLMPDFDGVDEIVRSKQGGCVRRGAQVQCWGETELLGNSDTSHLTPAPPLGCE